MLVKGVCELLLNQWEVYLKPTKNLHVYFCKAPSPYGPRTSQRRVGQADGCPEGGWGSMTAIALLLTPLPGWATSAQT